MIKCKPERDVRKAKMMIFICVSLLVLTALAATLVNSYKIFFELAFIALVTVIINIFVRYTMTEMEYEVGGGSFSVRKTLGQKSTVVCSLDLETAISFTPKAEYNEKCGKKEIPTVNVCYNFNQNIHCNSSYVYVCEFNGKNIAIEFEPNALFVSAMLEEIEKSKKM